MKSFLVKRHLYPVSHMVPRTPFCRRVFSVWSNVLDLIPEIIRLSGCLLLLQPSGRWHAVSNANRMPRPSPLLPPNLLSLFFLPFFLPPCLAPSSSPSFPFPIPQDNRPCLCTKTWTLSSRDFEFRREFVRSRVSFFVNSYFDLENVIRFKLFRSRCFKRCFFPFDSLIIVY